ncbi:von Hippel-Lindau disease tumor suppressor-like [Pocillopora verrucosa]|uniref:von Hippel-Lindau disease tumor suppressor-like n=1 Tax=Pocillopora verrucosa TaxID=203993 RepID=UPI00334253C6
MENEEPSSTPRSLHSRTGTPVRFINHSRSRVKLFWLDYQGRQVLCSTLEPSNGHYDVDTYVTHPWITFDEQTNQPKMERINSSLNVYFFNFVAVPYTLQENCRELVKKLVLPQNFNDLPLPQRIIREICQCD